MSRKPREVVYVSEIRNMADEIKNIYNDKGHQKNGQPRKIDSVDIWKGKDIKFKEDEFCGVTVLTATKTEMRLLLLQLKVVVEQGYDILDKNLITGSDIGDLHVENV